MPTLNQFEKDGTTYDIEDTTARNKKAVVVNTQKSGAEIGSVDGFKIYSPKITPAARQTSGYEIGSVSVDSAKTTFYVPKVKEHVSISPDFNNGKRIAVMGVDDQTYNIYLPPAWEKISTKSTTAGWNWVPINWDKYLEIVLLLTGVSSQNQAIFHYNDSSTPSTQYINSGNYIAAISMGTHPVAIDVKLKSAPPMRVGTDDWGACASFVMKNFGMYWARNLRGVLGHNAFRATAGVDVTKKLAAFNK